MIKRFHNISLYRLIATLLIVQFHIFYMMFTNYYSHPNMELFSKAVQGLTALSGFLYSQKVISDLKGFYLKNIKKIIIPAAICLFVMVATDLIVMLISRNYDFLFWLSQRRASNSGIVYQPNNYYYLGYITICYLITPLLQRNDKWSLITVIGVAIIELTLGFFFNIAIIALCYIVGYYIGRLAFNHYVDINIKFPLSRLFVWLGVIGLAIGLYILQIYVSFGNMYVFTHLRVLVGNIAKSMIGAASFFLFILVFRFINRFKEIRIFKFTDKLTYVIYLMNECFMIGGMNVASWANEMYLKIILVYVFTLASSIIIQLGIDYVTYLINQRKRIKTAY